MRGTDSARFCANFLCVRYDSAEQQHGRVGHHRGLCELCAARGKFRDQSLVLLLHLAGSAPVQAHFHFELPLLEVHPLDARALYLELCTQRRCLEGRTAQIERRVLLAVLGDRVLAVLKRVLAMRGGEGRGREQLACMCKVCRDGLAFADGLLHLDSLLGARTRGVVRRDLDAEDVQQGSRLHARRHVGGSAALRALRARRVAPPQDFRKLVDYREGFRVSHLCDMHRRLLVAAESLGRAVIFPATELASPPGPRDCGLPLAV
mmetsp:Transcript_2712/g.6577  ORF Transcript_2712/g.6577 Transcript_2712/m.6577 type:complete len:263 (-) Transcript_2712:455-1243(-)